MIIELRPEKHSDERWAVTLDMAARLAPDERIDLVEGVSYEVVHPRIVREYDTENADEVTFMVRRGKNTTAYTTSAPDIGPKVAVLMREETLLESPSVWDPSELVIEATRGKEFQIVLQGGEAGRTYKLDLNVHTDKGFIHKVFLIWSIEP